MKKKIIYKAEIGLRNTKVINRKEVFVDWRGRSIETDKLRTPPKPRG